MSLAPLHDRVRSLGLAAVYEKHARCAFRDLFDNASADWASTAMPQKVVDLKGFASAGVLPAEIIGHYSETVTSGGDARALDSLPATMRAYRDAGYWPPLPDDLDAAVDALAPAPAPRHLTRRPRARRADFSPAGRTGYPRSMMPVLAYRPANVTPPPARGQRPWQRPSWTVERVAVEHEAKGC